MKYNYHASAFSVGMISPQLWGRVDLEKYLQAVSRADNVIIDYRGGVKNRPGTRFLATLTSDQVRLWTYERQFNTNDYLLVFEPLTLKFVENGSYITSGGTPVTVVTPYTAADLPNLKFAQNREVLTITCKGQAVRELKFTGGVPSLTIPDFTNRFPRPNHFNTNPGGATGTYSFVWSCTAIFENGVEGPMMRPYYAENMPNIMTTNNTAIKYVVERVANAKSYRWYRSAVTEGSRGTIGMELGYIGETTDNQFMDEGIDPDYTRKPPIYADPFANGQLLSVTVTNGGTGYARNTTTIGKTAGPGSGALTWPIINDVASGGVIQDVLIGAWGEGYSGATTYAVAGGGGSGATVAIVVGPTSGNYPQICEYFQSRRVFAASDNFPNGIWGSHVDNLMQFTARPELLPHEGYSFYLDIGSTDPIKHMVAIQDSLLLFHAKGVHRLHASEGRVVTAADAIAEPQTAFGVGDASPVMVDNDLVYASVQGSTVFRVAFDQVQGGFYCQDLGNLATHLFERGDPPKRFAWQREPDKLLWIVKESGEVMTLTYSPDQEIYAWSRQIFQGRVLDMVHVRERRKNTIYLVIEREIAGVEKIFLERLEDRGVGDASDVGWFVDCGIRNSLTFPSVNLKVIDKATYNGGLPEGQVKLKATGVFTIGAVGKHVRAFGGLYLIISRIDDNTAIAQVVTEPRNDPFNTDQERKALVGYWSYDSQFTVFGGLTHLNGMPVSVNADGTFYEMTVAGNSITLPVAASRVTVGLPYTALVTTLPLNNPQLLTRNEYKRIISAAVRVKTSLGTEISAKAGWEELRENLVDQDNEEGPFDLYTGFRSTFVKSTWTRDKMISFRQRKPFPMEIAGYVLEVEGDVE